MKIDQDYLKALLNIFLDSKHASVWLDHFDQAGIPLDEKFLFHIQILEDQNLITCVNPNLDLGYRYSGIDSISWEPRPMRLTAAGHEFVEAINQSEIFEIIKQEFKEASLATLTNTAKTLLEAFAKKQLKKYFEL